MTSPGPRATSLDSRGFPRFWDEHRETMDLAQRDKLILDRIQHQLRYVYSQFPFYRRLYDAHGFKPEHVRSLEDFTTKVPSINKKMLIADQAENPIFGTYTHPYAPTKIARIHGSSGTSGVPTMYAVSRSDWQRAGEVHAMAQWCAGVRPDDLVQVGFPFGLFFGGWGVVQGAELLGATVFPLSITDSEKHVEFIHRLGTTVFSATPSYCIHLLSVAESMGILLAESRVRHLLVGGEPGGSLPGTREVIQRGWNAGVADAGSTSEMYPFQTSVGCEAGTGTHLFTDEVYTEIVSVDDLNTPVPDGQRGAIVYTHLWRDSQPMIRFAPGDESYLTREVCECERTYPRLPEGVLGRLDDMLVIRGANIFPSAIETGLRHIEGLGPEFRIRVLKVGALDEISVEVERDEAATDEKEPQRVEEELTVEAEMVLRRITGIRIPVTILPPGTLPPTTFKARRVLDERPKG